MLRRKAGRPREPPRSPARVKPRAGSFLPKGEGLRLQLVDRMSRRRKASISRSPSPIASTCWRGARCATPAPPQSSAMTRLCSTSCCRCEKWPGPNTCGRTRKARGCRETTTRQQQSSRNRALQARDHSQPARPFAEATEKRGADPISIAPKTIVRVGDLENLQASTIPPSWSSSASIFS